MTAKGLFYRLEYKSIPKGQKAKFGANLKARGQNPKKPKKPTGILKPEGGTGGNLPLSAIISLGADDMQPNQYGQEQGQIYKSITILQHRCYNICFCLSVFFLPTGSRWTDTRADKVKAFRLMCISELHTETLHIIIYTYTQPYTHRHIHTKLYT